MMCICWTRVGPGWVSPVSRKVLWPGSIPISGRRADRGLEVAGRGGLVVYAITSVPLPGPSMGGAKF